MRVGFCDCFHCLCSFCCFGRRVFAFAFEIVFSFSIFPGFASGPRMASPSAFGRSRALTSTDVLHALAATWHDKWQGGRCGFAHAT